MIRVAIEPLTTRTGNGPRFFVPGIELELWLFILLITGMRLLLASLFFPLVGFADMGSLPFKKGVEIFEPVQDAIIAWSGEEEVLLLATKLRASETTKILEVMPLPSKPSVTQGEFRSFVLANNLVRWKNAKSTTAANNPFGGPASPAAEPAGRVEEVKRIGAHDISVTEVLDRDAFVAWAGDYLLKNGAPAAVIPDSFAKVIGEYLQDGFNWFVFDIIELSPREQEKDVLRFRFKTDRLYFPLRITRSESGSTRVSLMILTEGRIGPAQFVGWPREKVKMPVTPVLLSGSEISSIDEHLWHVLKKPTGALLRTWEITGKLDAFDKDLLIRREP